MRGILSRKYQVLRHILRAYGRVAVACSGGADSALLLKVAWVVLGSSRVTAFHGISDLLPTGEAEQAAACARRFGCHLLRVPLQPLRWPEFSSNPPDRCYHCKKNIYRQFLSHPACDGVLLLDGSNADDLLEPRPGRRAIMELGVHTPLAFAGLTKKEVRLLGKRLGVLSWSAPSSSCLATRIASGEVITREKIQLVRHCEDLLFGMGFVGVRVRLAGELAIVEVLAKDLSHAEKSNVISVICEASRDAGVRCVELSPLKRSGVVL